jgi:hypothetical protein
VPCPHNFYLNPREAVPYLRNAETLFEFPTVRRLYLVRTRPNPSIRLYAHGSEKLLWRLFPALEEIQLVIDSQRCREPDRPDSPVSLARIIGSLRKYVRDLVPQSRWHLCTVFDVASGVRLEGTAAFAYDPARESPIPPKDDAAFYGTKILRQRILSPEEGGGVRAAEHRNALRTRMARHRRDEIEWPRHDQIRRLVENRQLNRRQLGDAHLLLVDDNDDRLFQVPAVEFLEELQHQNQMEEEEGEPEGDRHAVPDDDLAQIQNAIAAVGMAGNPVALLGNMIVDHEPREGAANIHEGEEGADAGADEWQERNLETLRIIGWIRDPTEVNAHDLLHHHREAYAWVRARFAELFVPLDSLEDMVREQLNALGRPLIHHPNR